MLNPEEFMQQTSEAALDTTLIPCPPGEWNAQIDKVEPKTFEYKSGERVGEQGMRLSIAWAILDDEPKRVCDRDKVSVIDSILLDLTPEGNLDFSKGKNIGLGRLREALGQNVSGRPWSPAMLAGQIAKVEVKAEVYNDQPQAKIAAVKAA